MLRYLLIELEQVTVGQSVARSSFAQPLLSVDAHDQATLTLKVSLALLAYQRSYVFTQGIKSEFKSCLLIFTT